MRFTFTENHIYSSNNCILKKYNDDHYRLIHFKARRRTSGWGLLSSSPESDSVNEPERFSSSISRSRSKVFELCSCNDFDYFITLTIDGSLHDRTDFKAFFKKFSQRLRDIRKTYGSDIKYIFVPEQHKDGAYHFHGLISGIPDSRLFLNSNGYLDWLDAKKFGFVSLDPIRDKMAVSAYITKYITKDLSKSLPPGSKSYYCSRNLNRSEKIAEFSVDAQLLDNLLCANFENEFLRLYTLTKDDVNNFKSLFNNFVTF